MRVPSDWNEERGGEVQRGKQNDSPIRNEDVAEECISRRKASILHMHPAERVTLRFDECASGNRLYLCRASMGLVVSGRE